MRVVVKQYGVANGLRRSTDILPLFVGVPNFTCAAASALTSEAVADGSKIDISLTSWTAFIPACCSRSISGRGLAFASATCAALFAFLEHLTRRIRIRISDSVRCHRAARSDYTLRSAVGEDERASHPAHVKANQPAAVADCQASRMFY